MIAFMWFVVALLRVLRTIGRVRGGSTLLARTSVRRERAIAIMFVVIPPTVGRGEAPDAFATRVVDASSSLDGSGLYNDPASVLGSPTDRFFDAITQEFLSVSLSSSIYNLAEPNGGKLLLTLNRGQFVKVRFAQPVTDDPRNPFGVDLIVFGNSFFLGSGIVGSDTDMATHRLTGLLFSEPVVVAVSSSGIGTPQTDPREWYIFDEGPFADELFPTNARSWDRHRSAWGTLSDFTVPVDPDLALDEFVGRPAADLIDAYSCSGGGTGFDLSESGMDAIQFVFLTSAGGEVDALSDASATLGDADRDGDVDLADAAAFMRCHMEAEGDLLLCGCGVFDIAPDGDVDGVDWSNVARWLTGPLCSMDRR